MSDNDQMKLFVDNLWRYFEPKIEEKMRSSIRYYRAEVTANPGGNRLTVQRPFDAAVTIPCVDCMSDAEVGDQVLVMVFGSGTNANNAVVVGDGSLRELGGSDTVPGQFYAGYGIELGHNLTNNIGGYIDFHYNGSDGDYTSRIIETAAGKIQVYGDLSASGKLNGLYIKAGCKVFQTTAANVIPVFTSDDLNTLFGTSGITWGMSNSVCFFSNGSWEAQSIPVCAACYQNVWNMVSTTGENFGDGSWFRVSYLAIGWT